MNKETKNGRKFRLVDEDNRIEWNELNIKEEKDAERKYFTTSLDERFDKVSKMIINDIEYETVDV